MFKNYWYPSGEEQYWASNIYDIVKPPKNPSDFDDEFDDGIFETGADKKWRWRSSTAWDDGLNDCSESRYPGFLHLSDSGASGKDRFLVQTLAQEIGASETFKFMARFYPIYRSSIGICLLDSNGTGVSYDFYRGATGYSTFYITPITTWAIGTMASTVVSDYSANFTNLYLEKFNLSGTYYLAWGYGGQFPSIVSKTTHNTAIKYIGFTIRWGLVMPEVGKPDIWIKFFRKLS